jgi:SAM-dependent methyltransferase
VSGRTVDEVIGFAVPPRSRFALADTGADGVNGDPVATARRMRDEGVEYLVLPGTEAPAQLLEEFRLVRREAGVCDVVSLIEPVRLRDRASDGLPLPPPEMIRLVAGQQSSHQLYRRFLDGGTRLAERIAAVARDAGTPLESLASMLDFGCGCGRTMRNWKRLERVALHGTDYNPYMIEWCRDNLSFASFEVNELEPDLPYPDDSFDLVYSYSVFTHLPEALQRPWIEELARVTRPGGHVFVTFHGEFLAARLPAAERERLLAGEVVTCAFGEPGTNAWAAYHPDAWVRALDPHLQVVSHLPGHRANPQDTYLLRCAQASPSATPG